MAAIRASNGKSSYALAKEYGVNSKTIRDIVARKIWNSAEGTQHV